MTHELRCDHKLQGLMLDATTLEVACSSRLCGAGSGIVIRHRFNIETGDFLSTHKYRNPERITAHGRNDRPDPSVRSA